MERYRTHIIQMVSFQKEEVLLWDPIMKYLGNGFLLFFLFLTTLSFAQISPGELAEPHAHLEGISNCTLCHELGKKVSEQKCLDCHTHLNTRIKAKQGYHYSDQVRQKSCIECHSDHHGRNFDIIRFDQDKFDHSLTGYILEGAHEPLECAECHRPDHIDNSEIRSKVYTFLGLTSECLNCHRDQHRGTLSSDCASCHNVDAFQPATLFDHDESAFPLKGKHKSVDCAKCHTITESEDKTFQEFAGISFSSCASCHKDVHEGRFGNNCAECHVETSFQILKGMEDFNHNRTSFPLKGKHLQLSCSSCHKKSKDGTSLFKEFSTIQNISCQECHLDVHEDKFGNNCSKCHDETSFQSIDIAAFNHNLTGYKLEGRHQKVDCSSCHTENTLDPLPHAYCMDCHTDFHESQFTGGGNSPDCFECHTMDGFSGSTFSIAQHNETPFILQGAHMATPCYECHLQDEKWLFKGIGSVCADCHDDVHRGFIDPLYYPENDCTNCHTPDRWNAISFDHERTDYTLEGAHLEQDCRACHIDETESGIIQVFNDLSSDCIDCHKDVHYGQFSERKNSDCLTCHYYADWRPVHFNHDSTDFKLEGKHAELECSSCHFETRKSINDELYLYYKIEKYDCVDCHG